MKVEFSAFPKAFSGNVAVFVAADKQLLASAQAIDKDISGTIVRAIDASRFGNLMPAAPRPWVAWLRPKPMPPARRR